MAIACLDPSEGLSDLIRACAILRARGVEFSCNIIGEVPLRRRLEQQIRGHGLEDTVKLVGVLNQRDIREILSRTQVFVLPCAQTENGDQDGIPVSLMEAMTLRIPVITTTVSGMPELVTDGVSGLLVPPHDPSSLAAALERLLKDGSLRIALGDGGARPWSNATM